MGFDDELRARLHELADREDDWPDPTAAAMQRATVVPADATSITEPSPVGPRSRVRRTFPMLAVAAVLVAVVVGVGAGVVALVHRSPDRSSASSASGGANAPVAAASGGQATAPGAANSLPTCGDVPGSTGALATIATVSAGATPAVAGGGTTQVPVTLTFSATGPAMQARAPQAYVVSGGSVIGKPVGASSFLIQNIPVAPGSVTAQADLTAAGCDGSALPAGSYQVVVVYPYTVAGTSGATSSLVSAPIEVQVR